MWFRLLHPLVEAPVLRARAVAQEAQASADLWMRAPSLLLQLAEALEGVRRSSSQLSLAPRAAGPAAAAQAPSQCCRPGETSPALGGRDGASGTVCGTVQASGWA